MCAWTEGKIRIEVRRLRIRFFVQPESQANGRINRREIQSSDPSHDQNGTSFFTANQLYAAYASKIPSPGRAVAVLSIIIGVVGLGSFAY
ncbi:MAG: hypothetical protein R3C53_11650 [Pirellulaceae bacterium]